MGVKDIYAEREKKMRKIGGLIDQTTSKSRMKLMGWGGMEWIGMDGMDGWMDGWMYCTVLYCTVL